MEDTAYYMFWSGLISTAVASVAYVVHAFGLRVGYSLAAATGTGNVVLGNGRAAAAFMGRVGTVFTWLAVLFLTTSLAARWSAAGRPPVSNMWEYTVGFGWGITLFYALFERHYVQRPNGWASTRTVGAFVMPLALGLLAVSEAFFPSRIQPLVPALQANRLLAAHVGTMMISYSALSVSFGAALMYLVQGEGRRFAQLPEQDTLEAIGYGSVLVGFPLLALGIALGAYWGNSAWGRYWGWDPKETSALVTWLVYAGYLHARGLRGWRGNRSAWLLIVGFVAVLFTFFAVNLWVSGLHSYAGVWAPWPEHPGRAPQRALFSAMIVDFHTHVFPPHVRDNRDEYLRRDPTFRELYSNSNARIITAEDVLASMERAGVDVSVILNFAWGEQELCRRTNDYILKSAAHSGGRLVPFCTVQPSAREDARREMGRCVRAGARGIGELRPENQGFELAGSEEADLLAWGARAYSLPLLLHASEPVGHPYPGKAGLSIESLYRFVESYPDLTVVAAHWGGGLPFYALMPEVRKALESTYFDTAATSLLYDPQIYRRAVDIVGAESILFGSDYPLLTQERCLREVRDASLEEEAQRLILGENARRLLDLPDET